MAAIARKARSYRRRAPCATQATTVLIAASIGAATVSAGFPVGGRLPIKGTMPAADNPIGAGPSTLHWQQRLNDLPLVAPDHVRQGMVS